MKVAIIGAGLIGCERISALQKISKIHDEVEISAVYDPDSNVRCNAFKKFNTPICKELDLALSNKPDWVFICTPHHVAGEIIKKSFEAGANVLVEKPLGRNLPECDEIIKYKPKDRELFVGFNFRFFAGIDAALKDCRMGKFGKLISVNLVLGHGNSPGMEKSWKLDPSQCGGGCLIDPGVHLLDLILNISSGPIDIKCVKTWRGFWNTGIEEEAHIIMSDINHTIFNTQISINKWRSTFRLEINGTEGYGIVEGRGRSYGRQIYRTGVRWGWQSQEFISNISQAISEVVVIDNDPCDDSFVNETSAILGLKTFNSMPCDYIKARQVMSLLDRCYQS